MAEIIKEFRDLQIGTDKEHEEHGTKENFNPLTS